MSILFPLLSEIQATPPPPQCLASLGLWIVAWLVFFFFFFFFGSFFSELGTEPGALRFLGKRSTTELNPQPRSQCS